MRNNCRQPIWILILTLATPIFNVRGQDMSNYLRQNAVRIDTPGKLNDSIYFLLSPFQLIMMGEMHGTNEPAKFTIGLTKLLIDNGDTVQLGLEIPSGQLNDYITNHTVKSIYLSDFFAKPAYESGRESFAWAEIISSFYNNGKVQLFFFDVNDNEYKNNNNRDSMMYLKIKKQITEHPKWKIITLSGNYHNRISSDLQYSGNTMADYLKHDKELNIFDKVCSINHYFIKGSGLNNNGSGLKLHDMVNYDDAAYATTFSFDSYFVLFPPGSGKPWNGVYYTKYVTPAKMVKGN